MEALILWPFPWETFLEGIRCQGLDPRTPSATGQDHSKSSLLENICSLGGRVNGESGEKFSLNQA